MKTAKVIKGIRVKFNTVLEKDYYENFHYSSKEQLVKNLLGRHPLVYDNEDVAGLEVETDVLLYEAVTCIVSNIEPDIIIRFRKTVGKPNFYKNNGQLLTVDEIKYFLDNSYAVAVKGLGEIDSIDELN